MRKQLGVWYTPPEVVRYMVARVDRALKDDLGIADGLAAENVYVLDPCCGTGAYLAETLRRIAENLQGQVMGALTGARVKKAAMERVFGFEIMPAPFVVAQLQVGLTMEDLDAPLADDGAERAGIFLTNALTGWEPQAQKLLPFPELQEERDRAERVKQKAPILVILGNPPYNGFPGVAVEEERALTDAYREVRHVRRPEGRGLNDLYVRFFRMAERRIAENTGQGVVCFISNSSWLDGLSFTGMRERYLDSFDVVHIDNLNGDKFRTGKVAPDGSPDPSIFSTPDDPVGIQVGTAITTLVRKAEHSPARIVQYRNLWGQTKLRALTETAETDPDHLYDAVEPLLPLGLPFASMDVSSEWFDWPSLPQLFPRRFHGVLTNRDAFLVDIDLDRLKTRVSEYFDAVLSHDEIARRYPRVMQDTGRFDARAARDALLRRGGPLTKGFVRFTYRPFDTRWLYWEAETKLLDEKRADYKPHVFAGNLWLTAAQHLRQGATEPQAAFTGHLGSHHLIERGSNLFPAWLRDVTLGTDMSGARHSNLSPDATWYLEHLDLTVADLFHHVLAVLHDSEYREANAGALRMEWPRIPLPHWTALSARSETTDNNHAAKVKEASKVLGGFVARGRELAALLDPDTPVPGVTAGQLRPEIAAIAVPATTHGRNMLGDDFELTMGWGHFGARQAVMPGQGCAVERAYTGSEREALSHAPEHAAAERRDSSGDLGMTVEDALKTLGETTYDIYLNDHAYWRNVPAKVWNFRLGGYQVLKKWLSYRERRVLGRCLALGEIQHFTEMARRICVILLRTRTDIV